MLNNLAIISRTKGRLAEAEDFYLRAIAINEKSLGPQHASLGMPLINLAELYTQLQRYAEAERFHRRALTILDAALGPDHAEIAFALAQHGGELSRAETLRRS